MGINIRTKIQKNIIQRQISKQKRQNKMKTILTLTILTLMTLTTNCQLFGRPDVVAPPLHPSIPRHPIQPPNRNLVGRNGRIPGSYLPFATSYRPDLLMTLRNEGPQTPVFVTKYRERFRGKPNPLMPKRPVNGADYLL